MNNSSISKKKMGLYSEKKIKYGVERDLCINQRYKGKNTRKNDFISSNLKLKKGFEGFPLRV